jgi:Protein of unknown function (DUF642)/PEP-CTERM motif
MPKHSFVAIISIALAFLCSNCPASMAGIVNGSFEIPNVGVTGITEISPGHEPAGFAWKVDAGTVEVFGDRYSGLPGPAFDGTQLLDLNGVSIGTLSQTFTTSPGTLYQLSFAYANNYVHTNKTSPALATVHLTDAVSGTNLITPYTISHGTSTSTNLDWTVSSFTYVATGQSTTLRFVSNTSDPIGGTLLDGVSLTPLSVPEPSSVILLGAGLMALGLARAARQTGRTFTWHPR